MLELDVMKWAQEQFGTCQLGDSRRSRRAVLYAAQAAADPDGSTPQQTENWADLKAAYRLFDAEQATFRALAEPHWRRTRESFADRRRVLLIDDTTDVCFTHREKIDGMGMIKREQHQGFLLHSSLAVDAQSGEVLGLAAQTIRHRRRVPRGHARQRLKRTDRESRIWGDVIDLVGGPPRGTVCTHVGDRGADNFEVYCHLLAQGVDWVVRAAQLTRAVVFAEQRLSIKQVLASLPRAGGYELELRSSAKHPGRTAHLEVRLAQATMPAPKMTSRFVKQCGVRSIPMYLVEVREVKPAGVRWPRNVKPLHWVLHTSHEVKTFEQAYAVIEMYEKRPIVEEYHKALKTGCRLESRQYETAPRLEAATGVLAVVAVRLLQLKTAAQRDPDRSARQVLPPKWIAMLSRIRKRPIVTVRQFFRALAGLGGFLNRKSDGEPGWITLWRGFEKLHLLLRGAAAQKYG